MAAAKRGAGAADQEDKLAIIVDHIRLAVRARQNDIISRL